MTNKQLEVFNAIPQEGISAEQLRIRFRTLSDSALRHRLLEMEKQGDIEIARVGTHARTIKRVARETVVA